MELIFRQPFSITSLHKAFCQIWLVTVASSFHAGTRRRASTCGRLTRSTDQTKDTMECLFHNFTEAEFQFNWRFHSVIPSEFTMLLLCPAQELVLGTQPEAPVTELIWWQASAQRGRQWLPSGTRSRRASGGDTPQQSQTRAVRPAFAAMQRTDTGEVNSAHPAETPITSQKRLRPPS